jgi:hypothetical protein
VSATDRVIQSTPIVRTIAKTTTPTATAAMPAPATNSTSAAASTAASAESITTSIPTTVVKPCMTDRRERSFTSALYAWNTPARSSYRPVMK